MPSHISHSLLAEAVAHDCHLRLSSSRGDLLAGLLHLGAQGPDLFLHNHRRKPRGFRYGAILHRKGNARVLLSLADSARENGYGKELSHFSLGYITHVWFDRLAHPYINWSAGWRSNPDNHPDRPAMHAFLERLIDVQLLRRLRDLSVGEYGFYFHLPRQPEAFFRLRPALEQALRSSLVSAGSDVQLSQRLSNSLHDSLGFYRHTESPDNDYFVAARQGEKAGTVSRRWLSVVHPPETLISVDALNIEGRTWGHPCRPEHRSSAGIPELMTKAVELSVKSYSLWCAYRDSGGPEDALAFEEELGPWNLNDGITTDPPCRRQHCDPLPLLELYETIKTAVER